MKNLSKMNCKNVRNYINENLLPNVYKTYLKETIHDNLPSFEDLLEEYGLSRKGISHMTTWRWLIELHFEYKEREKVIFQINMSLKKMFNIVKSSLKNISRLNWIRTGGSI